ncbi:MAG: hypothetical protein GY906_13680 [bacterium]|nr:hypothetical protein [bacterium]
MSRLETKLDVANEEFKANVDFMSAYVDRIRELEANGRAREEVYRERATKRGKGRGAASSADFRHADWSMSGLMNTLQ